MSRMRDVLRKSETPGWDERGRQETAAPSLSPDGLPKPKPPASTNRAASYWASQALEATTRRANTRPMAQARANEPLNPAPWSRTDPQSPAVTTVLSPNLAGPAPVATKTDVAPSTTAAIEVLHDLEPQTLPETHPRLSGMEKIVRKVRRWLGLSVGRTPARCSGNARSGMPCRAPAMDNGFCRMHGGKRVRSIAERLR